MTTKYVTNDGERFTAANALEVVLHLRMTAWEKTDDSHAKFMADMAARVQEQTGAVLDVSNAATFVTGLLATGLLKEDKQ